MRAIRRRTIGSALLAALATAGFAGAAHAAPPAEPPAPDRGDLKAGQQAAPPLTGAEATSSSARRRCCRSRGTSPLRPLRGLRHRRRPHRHRLGTVHVYRTDTGAPLGLSAGSPPA